MGSFLDPNPWELAKWSPGGRSHVGQRNGRVKKSRRQAPYFEVNVCSFQGGEGDP